MADRHGDGIFVDASGGKSAVWSRIMQCNFKIADNIASFFGMMARGKNT